MCYTLTLLSSLNNSICFQDLATDFCEAFGRQYKQQQNLQNKSQQIVFVQLIYELPVIKTVTDII